MNIIRTQCIPALDISEGETFVRENGAVWTCTQDAYEDKTEPYVYVKVQRDYPGSGPEAQDTLRLRISEVVTCIWFRKGTIN